jgi:hypothetical protein
MKLLQTLVLASAGLFVANHVYGDNMATRKPTQQAQKPAAEETQQAEQQQQELKGRSVFVVNTTPAGVTVQTAFLTDEGKLMNMPAVFPDVEYAFAQIDELRRLVSRHFSEAAKLGGQVIQNQQNAQQQTTSDEQKH